MYVKEDYLRLAERKYLVSFHLNFQTQSRILVHLLHHSKNLSLKEDREKTLNTQESILSYLLSSFNETQNRLVTDEGNFLLRRNRINNLAW